MVLAAFLLALPLLSVRPGLAQSAAAAPDAMIRDIVVEGIYRVERATVLSYVTLSPGDAFSAGEINRSVKALFATGLFADVTLRRDADTLLVRVVENPVINVVAYEGNLRISDDELRAETRLKSRMVYTGTLQQPRAFRRYRRSEDHPPGSEPG